jgi:predicted nucleotidyltransferase
MKYGLEDKDVEKIIETVSAVPTVSGIVLYGSRAMGNYKPGSDIDIVLLGDAVSHDDVLDVISSLDTLGMLYTFDIQPMSGISSPDLLSHIQRKGVVLFNRLG